MSDLSKSKKIVENVSDSRQLTALIKELNNAIRGLKPVDEYLTRFSKAKEVLGKESIELGEIVDQKRLISIIPWLILVSSCNLHLTVSLSMKKS